MGDAGHGSQAVRVPGVAQGQEQGQGQQKEKTEFLKLKSMQSCANLKLRKNWLFERESVKITIFCVFMHCFPFLLRFWNIFMCKNFNQRNLPEQNKYF